MGLYKLRNNPHPARGRKPPPGREAHQPLETTHTPQGDGNSRGMILTVPISETTHTPQGDGNLFDVHAFLRTRKQPTPRKGTETGLILCRVVLIVETTHTPQGDGNAQALLSLLCSSETTHTPQGDGNGVESILVAQDQRETTHTPQGDGNSISLLNSISFIETTHTPQGDGNLDGIEPVADLGRNNPHPARGRKLHGLLFARATSETTHTPQGDGNCSVKSQRDEMRKQPTPRKGTETRLLPAFCCCRRNNPHPARGRKPPC